MKANVLVVQRGIHTAPVAENYSPRERRPGGLEQKHLAASARQCRRLRFPAVLERHTHPCLGYADLEHRGDARSRLSSRFLRELPGRKPRHGGSPSSLTLPRMGGERPREVSQRDSLRRSRLRRDRAISKDPPEFALAPVLDDLRAFPAGEPKARVVEE
jgi:hypothetical protein